MGTQAATPMLSEPGDNPTPPGTEAPQEVGTPKGKAQKLETPAQDYGPNNEKLPKRLQLALNYLLTLFVNEGQKARRDEVKKVRLAREFWKGLQYQYWSESDGLWHLPWEQRQEGTNDGQDPRYAFVTNYYQAFGLSIMAVLSQDIPAVRAWPENAQDPVDVATSAAADDVIELVERNNRVQDLMVDEAFYLWCDGKVGGYVRYVTDGQRFGYHDEPVLGERPRKMGDDGYNCPNCSTFTPAHTYMGTCAYCGQDLNEDHFQQADVVPMPVVQDTIEMPNGQEVIDIVGSLELKTPPWANKQHQFPYLILDQLAHRSLLRSSFPHVAKEIGGASVTPEDTQAQYERTAAITLVSGGEMEPIGAAADLTNNLITFRQAWLRPWAIEILDEDDVKKQLRDLFPTGVYCAFAGDRYCVSRNEAMDDHWRVLHAMPGDGQNRPAMGTSFISVQERYNTLSNLLLETAEHGIPSTWANPAYVDFDAIRDSYVEPGDIYPATAPAGTDLRTAFFQTQAAQVPGDVVQHMQELPGQIGQFLTGAFPALFGGEMTGNDTAQGYAMARDQALGRIGLVWRRMKWFHAELMMLAVDVFRKNRSDDVCFTVWGDNNSPKAKWIRRADLKGACFVYPETDSQYPEIPAMKRAVLQQLMTTEDPKIQEILGSVENLSIIKRIVGLEELVVPDEDSRNKQRDEIDQMLEEGEQGIGPVAAPLTMGPMGPTPAPPQSTIPIDEILDNHAIEFEECRTWANSEAGQRAKRENPLGYENVRFHAQAHQQAAGSGSGPQDLPKEAINFKDLPPSGKLQMAGQAGIQLDPGEVLDQQNHDRALAIAKAKAPRPQPGGAA